MKISKKIGLLFAAAVVGLGVFAGCSNSSDKGSSDSSKKASDKLVIYSPNSETLIQATIPAFEKKYDIKVELIQAGTGELFKKIESEAGSPIADVIFGGNYTLYAENGKLFQDYKSPEDKNVDEKYRNTTGYATPYTLDGSVLIVNPDLTKGMTIDGYEDLLNPDLKGKISTADPTNSSSAFSQLTNMLVDMGGYDNDKAWTYVDKLFKNIDGKISSSSSDVYKKVSDGEMAVGLSYEDPVAQLLNDGAKVKLVYPKEGTVFLPASAAIVKDAKNLANAKKFIDFIISKDLQNTLAKDTTNRPVRNDVEMSENMKPLADINVKEEDYDYVNKHKDEIVQKYNEIFVNSQS
jgi:iron(III) transport system substrate-binding protein